MRSSLARIFTWLDFPPGMEENGDIPYREMTELVKLRHEDVSYSRLRRRGGHEENLGNLPRDTGQKFLGLSKAQPWWQLPVEFAGVPNGHDGTHVFLVNDFVRSVKSHRLPPNHVWLAARYNAPGIVAHESWRGGELMKIPISAAPGRLANPGGDAPLQP